MNYPSLRLCGLLCCCVLPVLGSGAVVGGEFLPDTRLEFSKVPARTPATHSVDGPLLGNGDMKVAIGGAPEAQRFHLGKNDMWRLQHGYGNSSPVTFGELVLDIPALKGAGYRVEMPLDDPRAEATFKRGAVTVTQSSRVLADRNLLWIRLEAQGGEVEVNPVLKVKQGRGSVSTAGYRDGLLVAARSFPSTVVDIPSGAAVAVKVLGAEVKEGKAKAKPVSTQTKPFHVEIGREQAQGGRWSFQGVLDELAIYPGALTAADITKVRDGTYAGKPRHHWDFEKPLPNSHGVKTVEGKAGKALLFAGGKTSRVDAGVIELPADVVSIASWISIDQVNDEANYIVSCGEWNKGVSLGLSAGKLRFSVQGRYVETKPLPLKKWLHVAAVWNGSDMVVYVDGKVAASKTGGSDLAAGASFMLVPGKPVDVVLAMDSVFDAADYQSRVVKAARELQQADLAAMARAHRDWWSAYWQRSWIKIGDPELELAYYRSLYGIGACSRNLRFPAAIFGWDTTDEPSWHGDYHLNYNHFAPFYAMYSANRLEQGDPQDTPMLEFIKRGAWYAKNVTKTRGVLFPVGIGPCGIETTNGRSSHVTGANAELGGLFFQQRSNAAYSLVNIAQRWRCSYDLEYAKKVYPLVRDVALFWEDYLVEEKGRYVIVGDAVHEGSGQDLNPILSLGMVRNSLDLALDMSAALRVDLDKKKKWQHILTHLSGWSTQEMKGKTVFRYTEKGTAWWPNNTLGIQQIYPANCIGLDSDAKWLKVAHNTIDVMGRWLDGNGSNSFFPAAVRVGYDPEVILGQLRRYSAHTYPNGFQAGNPHGIENLSTVPNTLNEMLCMSHVPVGGDTRKESVIRVFPVWPKDKDARFHQIRCWGAFLVSSELKNSRVQYVKITSERGRTCTVVNPWPGKNVVLVGPTRKEVLKGDTLSFETTAGEALELREQK
ncbi:MAG: hypothetical protein H7A51_14100 [Akkermansiaceae bacterium]|nr:hypothetical protein [Akkermansiaceae bacterium]